MKTSDEQSWEYFQKETDYLRGVYLELRKEIRSLEVYSLVIVGGIWSWTVSNIDSRAVIYLAWLAFIAIALFGIRSLGIYFQICLVRKYLLRIESKYNTEITTGWEHFQNKQSSRMVWPVTSILFWTILSIVTSIFPFFIKGLQ